MEDHIKVTGHVFKDKRKRGTTRESIEETQDILMFFQLLQRPQFTQRGFG